MKSAGLKAIMAASLVFLFTAIPLSSASTVSVHLDPSSNSASVNAYMNTTVEITANSSNPVIFQILKDSFSTSALNLSLSDQNMGQGTLPYQILNDSISEKVSGIHIESLSIYYGRAVKNMSTATGFTVFVNSSLQISMTIAGLFSGNSANMSWRGFQTNQSISVKGENLNQFNLSGYASVNSNPVVNTINLSAFSESLVKWNRTYDSISNTTSFYMSAGNAIDLNLQNNLTGISLTYVMDPSFTITSPGYDTAGANTIAIGSPPAGNPVIYYSVFALLLGGGLISYYFMRMRARKP